MVLAVASNDNFIDLYNGRSFERTATCKGHSSFVTQIQWSADGEVLASVSGDYELLYWNGKTGEQLKDRCDRKPTVAHTQTHPSISGTTPRTSSRCHTPLCDNRPLTTAQIRAAGSGVGGVEVYPGLAREGHLARGG